MVWRENSVSYIIVVTARSIAVHTGGLAEKSILACGDTERRELDKNPTKFLRRVLKLLSRAKKSRKTLFDGKSKGPLLARAVLNNEVCLSQAMFSKNMLENLRENLVRILQS